MLLFLIGGGSRADISSLVLVRPIAVVLCAWWALRLDGAALKANRWFFFFAAATFALGFIHLIPLPPAMWRALPGREIVSQIDSVAGLGDVWRSLTLAPTAATNAMWSLFVPLAAGLGMANLSATERRAILPVVLVMATVSLAVSLLQIFAPGAGFLWFYRITNSGSPVGLFANRNHNAVFLASVVPLVVAWAIALGAEQRAAFKRALAAVFIVMVAIVELVSGSRSGIIVFAAAICASALLLPVSWTPKRRTAHTLPKWILSPRRTAMIALAVFAPLAALFGARTMTDTNALARLTDSGTGDFRPVIWEQTWSHIVEYLPFGSGLGSFVEAYRLGERPSDIMPSYINHAHNDFLEIALTTGIPGILLLAAFLAFLAWKAALAWRMSPTPGSHVRFARAASASIGVLVAASFVDYPIRTPSIVAFFVIAVFWLLSPRAGQRSTGKAR